METPLVGFLNLFWVAHVYEMHGDIPVTSIPGLGSSWEEPESAVMRPRFILREGAGFLLLPCINHHTTAPRIMHCSLGAASYKEGPEVQIGEGLA